MPLMFHKMLMRFGLSFLCIVLSFFCNLFFSHNNSAFALSEPPHCDCWELLMRRKQLSRQPEAEENAGTMQPEVEENANLTQTTVSTKT